MFTIKKLNTHIEGFLLDLKKDGLSVKKAILFGSYANGNVHENSDIDIAIWTNEFNENLDYSEKLNSIIAKYYPIHPKFYSSEDDSLSDPFIEIIQKTGRQIC